MLVKDLFGILNTDSVVLANDTEILVNVETVYIEKALQLYGNMDVKKLTPLNNAIEIIVE